MTTNGGHHNDGVIFKLNIDDQSFHLLHRFGETNHDGINPYGSLLLVGDQLYGTTANGGDNDMGNVFVIRTDGHGYQRLYSFGGQAGDGSKPTCRLCYRFHAPHRISESRFLDVSAAIPTADQKVVETVQGQPTLFEIVRLLVRLNQLTRVIVRVNHSIARALRSRLHYALLPITFAARSKSRRS
jgi:uncharacterized repeat protein (TIGR03803 family)